MGWIIRHCQLRHFIRIFYYKLWCLWYFVYSFSHKKDGWCTLNISALIQFRNEFWANLTRKRKKIVALPYDISTMSLINFCLFFVMMRIFSNCPWCRDFSYSLWSIDCTRAFSCRHVRISPFSDTCLPPQWFFLTPKAAYVPGERKGGSKIPLPLLVGFFRPWSTMGFDYPFPNNNPAHLTKHKRGSFLDSLKHRRERSPGKKRYFTSS